MKGLVLKSTGSWYQVLTDDGNRVDCRIKGNLRLKDYKSTNPLAVGDRVELEMETGCSNGIISAIEERKNYIIRKSINLSKQTHILAANIDLAVIVASIAQPRTAPGFIDRFLVTAEAYHIPVLIVFNKIDLHTEEDEKVLTEMLRIYRKAGYECMPISALDEKQVNMLKDKLQHKINLLAGHSGVGKSTLINSLDSEMQIKTGIISTAHNKGKHTTTHAEMHEMKGGGFIIDTPGIKEFGVVDLQPEELTKLFPEFAEYAEECKFSNCLHHNEPKCKVKEMYATGEIAESRYKSYLRILLNEEDE